MFERVLQAPRAVSVFLSCMTAAALSSIIVFATPCAVWAVPAPPALTSSLPDPSGWYNSSGVTFDWSPTFSIGRAAAFPSYVGEGGGAVSLTATLTVAASGFNATAPGGGGYAYYAYAMDVTNPAAPVVLGAVAMTSEHGYAANVFRVNSTTAYYYDGYNDLTVIDFSNPAKPKVLSSRLGDYGDGRTERMCINGAAAYAADGWDVNILSLASVSAPVKVGVLDSNERVAARDLVCDNTRLYVSSSEGLSIWDITSPLTPRLLGTYAPLGTRFCYGVAMWNGYVLATFDDGMRIIDPTDAENPQVVRYMPDIVGEQVRVFQNHAYVLDGSALKVVAIDPPSEARLVGAIAATGGSWWEFSVDRRLGLARADWGYGDSAILRIAAPQGYAFSFDQSPSTVPAPISRGNTALSHTISNLSDGVWYFHLRLKDEDGLWSDTTHRSVRIDRTPPAPPVVSSTTNPDTARWYTSEPEASWRSSDISGIDGYSYVLDQNPTTVPPPTASTVSTSASFGALTPGRWYLHVRARNGSGLWSATSHRPFLVATDSTTLTLTSSSSKVKYGQTVKLTGRITPSTSERVELWASTDNGLTWKKDGDLVPSDGSFSARRVPKRNTKYQVRFRGFGTSGLGSSSSGVVSVRCTVAVGNPVVAKKLSRTKKHTIYAHVNPKTPLTLKVYKRNSKGIYKPHKTIKGSYVKKTSSGYRYNMKWRPTSAGKYRLHIQPATPKGMTSAKSGYRYVTVK